MKPNRTSVSPDYTAEQKTLDLAHTGLADIPSVTLSHYSRNWSSPPAHCHRGILELCFCRRGALQFECNGQDIHLLPNNIIILQPHDLHHLITNHKGMVSYWLTFRYPPRDKPVLGLSQRESRALTDALRDLPSHCFAADKEVGILFPALFRAFDEMSAGALRTLTLRSIVLRLLLLVIRSSSCAPTNGALATITNIAKDLATDPSRRFSIAELAAKAKLSEGRFTTLFREVTGLPPHAYMNDLRLKEVRRLLEESDDSITDIASRLGYSSAQHLATQFRHAFGMTPTASRNACQNQGRK